MGGAGAAGVAFFIVSSSAAAVAASTTSRTARGATPIFSPAAFHLSVPAMMAAIFALDLAIFCLADFRFFGLVLGSFMSM